ncbi:hypothetical protein EDB19DRAFT_1978039 [Suillus lakei]|nr:hypothetical protein EDB19DRAFT_1978039 [Suillus lakei]
MTDEDDEVEVEIDENRQIVLESIPNKAIEEEEEHQAPLCSDEGVLKGIQIMIDLVRQRKDKITVMLPSNGHVDGSPPSTPPVSLRGSVTAASTVSETDDDVFPLTPDSKRSGDPHYVADISGGAGSSTPSRYHKQHFANNHHHPYRRTPSFQDRHIFECMLGSSDCDSLLEDMKGKTDDGFLRYMDMLGPQSFRLVVHYKEAVRERKRLDLYVAYWAREETKRLDTIRRFVLLTAQEEYARAEREAAVLLNRLLERHPPSTGVDAQSLTRFSDRCRRSLGKTDAQLDLLKDRIMREHIASSPDDLDDNLDAAQDRLADDKSVFTPMGKNTSLTHFQMCTIMLAHSYVEATDAIQSHRCVVAQMNVSYRGHLHIESDLVGVRLTDIVQIFNFNLLTVTVMQPFEFGAPLPPNDDYELDFAFDFDCEVGTVNPYVLDIQMPVPRQPWRGFVMPPLPSESSASASGSGSQLQQSLVNVRDSHCDTPPQLQSNYSPGAPGYLVPPPYHPMLNESQLGSFFPDFSQPVLSMDNETLLPVGAEYRDEPRRAGILDVEGTLGQKNSGKRKDRVAKQTEYISWPAPKRVRLRRPIAKAPSMLVADTEPSAVPSQPQPAASPPPFAPLNSEPSMAPSQSVLTV